MPHTQLTAIPAPDLAQHPAFREFGNAGSAKDAATLQLISDIEGQCAALASGSREKLSDAFATQVVPKFEQLKSLALSGGDLPAPFRDYVARAIQRAADFVQEDLRARSMKASGLTPTKRARELAAAVERDGFCRVTVDAGLARRVWRASWWERGLMRKRAELTPGRHAAMALHDYSPASRAIQRAIADHGVLEAAGAYLGQPMQFLYAALDHAHERQSWYKDCYADVGLPTSRTAYMHFDADSNMVKAMLYLRDVSPDGGPFRYVRGSHRWQRSSVQCALNRAFDEAQAHAFPLEDDGLDYRLGYYRPRYKVAEFRRALMSLPSALRGSTHFGDDVLDGSPLSDSLLGQEETFVGPAGTLVLFDGSRGIHRGSQVVRGERWAVQIGMRVHRPVPKGRFPRPARTLVNLARYQVQRLRGVMHGG